MKGFWGTALLALAAGAAMLATPVAAQERMRAGLWEMTTTSGGKVINTGTRCMTPQEIAANNGDAKSTRGMLEQSFAKASCKVTDMTVADKAISYSADCGSGASAHTLSSVAAFHGDTVEFQMTVKRAESVQTMLTKGRRIGACP